jgi:restriction system protein
MSRRNPSAADTLVMLPWQVSATLAVVAFAGLRWVLPNVAFENSFFATFAKAASGLSWFALIGFGILAGLSALLAAKKRALLDGQRDLESLRALSWQQFEWMVGEAYRRQGYSVEESLAGGADGGIDIILRKDGQTSLVQCKRWKTQSVGAAVIREMFGLLAHHRADYVIVVTSGQFTREALAFAENKPIDLIDGRALLTLVQTLQAAPITNAPAAVSPPSPSPTPPSFANAMRAAAEPILPETVPVVAAALCPTCGASMVKRTAKRGSNAGNSFWGCSNYPTCRGVRNV